MLFVSEPLKACNVDVRPVEFVRYADARTALLSGSIDVSGIGPADLAIALAPGSDKLVDLPGVASPPKYLATRKGVKIDTWKDLAVQRLGLATGSAAWVQWAAPPTAKDNPST